MDNEGNNDRLEMKNQSDYNNKILIITGGHIDEIFVKAHLEKVSYQMIIVADHGLVIADHLNLTMDYILGDFDSVPEIVLKKYREKSIPIKTFPREKDKTDTQIAIELALKQNPSHIDLIGATGSRMDHTLGNVHLLMLALDRNVNACILDSNNKIYLKKNNFAIKKDEQFGQYVSFLAFSWTVSGLTLKGFKYPLNNITLSAGTSMGVSNEILDEEAYIEVEEGILVVVESKD